MKNLRFFSMVCVFALAIGSLAGCHKDENGNNNNGNNNGNGGSGGGTAAGYVDLGLPSGTKWKETNEIGNGTGFYNYDEAVRTFGRQLPTKNQLEELTNYCSWTWQNNSGYKVVGPNGNFIVLPALGYRNCNGDVRYVGHYGDYWSSTPNGSDNAWRFCFNYREMRMNNYGRCNGLSVRLVQD